MSCKRCTEGTPGDHGSAGRFLVPFISFILACLILHSDFLKINLYFALKCGYLFDNLEEISQASILISYANGLGLNFQRFRRSCDGFTAVPVRKTHYRMLTYDEAMPYKL